MSLEGVQRFLSGELAHPEVWYGQISAALRRFVNLDFDARLYDVVTCNIMASYFYDLFGVFPIITIFGPFETGKGRLLQCITFMGHRGMSEVDPSDASIFRSIEAWKPLLGIDEFHEIGPRIERILRSGYKKGAKVPRMEKTRGGEFYLSLFDTFSKVVIASDKRPPANILQKGILISMRKMPDPNPEKRDPTAEDFEEIRTNGYIARLTWMPTVKEAAERLNILDLGLSGRGLEVWKPALTIASMLGEEIWKNVLDYAKESRADIATESYEELKEILEAIYQIIKEKCGEFPVAFTPKQIHDLIWEKLRDDYKIVREKQEREGEAVEKYDYDTRSFEQLYNTRKIGRTYLVQLCLRRGRHTEAGTQYRLSSAREFNELVERYHPDLKKEKEDYADLILTQKIMSESSQTSATSNFIFKPGLQGADKCHEQITRQHHSRV